MKLGTKGRYAVMAMVDIAAQGQGKPIILGDVAERQKISTTYLEQLFVKLRKAGLVESVRGKGGGYLLSREAGSISINDIFQAVGEPIKATACNSEDFEGCMGPGVRCATHKLWEGLSGVMREYLQKVTLADMACEPQALKNPEGPWAWSAT